MFCTRVISALVQFMTALTSFIAPDAGYGAFDAVAFSMLMGVVNDSLIGAPVRRLISPLER